METNSSTFMMEIKEIALMLNHSSDRSELSILGQISIYMGQVSIYIGQVFRTLGTVRLAFTWDRLVFTWYRYLVHLVQFICI